MANDAGREVTGDPPQELYSCEADSYRIILYRTCHKKNLSAAFPMITLFGRYFSITYSHLTDL